MGLVSSLSSILGISETAAPVTAAISELDPITGQEKSADFEEALFFGETEGIKSAGFQAFQYFPETITDNKSPEWIRKNMPGGSHPILSFLNGGERIISFAAVFTQDENPEPIGALASILTGSFEIGLSDLFGGGAERKDTADISAALAFLRKFTYPNYKESVAQAPPFAIIYLPNSGIIGQSVFVDSIVGAMVQCDVTYEKFHRNGAPRICVVNLSFVETVQIGENWSFVGRADINDNLDFQNFGEGRKPYTREVLAADQGGSGSLLDLLPF